MLSLDSENEEGDVRRVVIPDHLLLGLLKALDLCLTWEQWDTDVDYKEPRQTSEEDFPFHDSNITFLAFLKRDSFHARTVAGKLKLLKRMKPGQGILAFWPLDHKREAYLVDNIEQAIEVLEARV